MIVYPRYVSLSRDTTESDLKQRREIVEGTAFYCDQAAVQAATQVMILINQSQSSIITN